MIKTVRTFLNRNARAILLSLAICLAAGYTMFYRLGSLTKGFSEVEVASLRHSLSLHTIFHDPLNLPLSILQWLALHSALHHYFLARLPSVLLGIAALTSLAYILARWYGRRAMFFGIVLAASSSWFLHISRSASPDILYYAAIPTLLACHLLFRDHPHRFLIRLGWLVVHVVCLFIPGLVWLVVVNIILQRREAKALLLHPGSLWQAAVLYLSLLLGLAYLGYSLSQDTHVLRVWLGLPTSFDTWKIHAIRLVQSVSYFVVRGPHEPALWLGRLPILGAVWTLFLLAGILFYARHWQAPRTQLLLALFVVSAILFALNGPVRFSLLVPVVTIISVAGIAYLLHIWLKVFPRNPLARGLGLSVVCVAVAFSVVYNMRAYFVAWPHNKETQRVMQLPPPTRTT